MKNERWGKERGGANSNRFQTFSQASSSSIFLLPIWYIQGKALHHLEEKKKGRRGGGKNRDQTKQRRRYYIYIIQESKFLAYLIQNSDYLAGIQKE